MLDAQTHYWRRVERFGWSYCSQNGNYSFDHDWKEEFSVWLRLKRNSKACTRKYYEYEWTWAELWKTKKPIAEITIADLISLIEKWKESVVGLDKLLYEDAKKIRRLDSMTGFGMDETKKLRSLTLSRLEVVLKRTTLWPKSLVIGAELGTTQCPGLTLAIRQMCTSFSTY